MSERVSGRSIEGEGGGRRGREKKGGEGRPSIGRATSFRVPPIEGVGCRPQTRLALTSKGAVKGALALPGRSPSQ